MTRTNESSERVTSDPGVMLGKPIVAGTRIPVELLLRKLAEGAAPEDLLEAYPNVERSDILAVLAYS